MKFVVIAQVSAILSAVAVSAVSRQRNLRKLPEMTSKGFLGAKPAPSECENGDRYCTCRDGSQCNNTEDCKDLGVGGSCEVRTPTRSNGKSCRNGDSCIDGNTACADGSKCKVRDGSGNDDGITEVGRKLPEMTSKGFLGAKPAPSECENGDRYCTCRDGSQCNNTEDCKDLGVGGSCEVRTPTRSNGKSCRNGDSCIDGNTACADGSKCKVRDGSSNDDGITEVGRKLPEMTSKGFLGAKPAPSECENGDRYCTCRDGSQCNNTEDCKDLGVGGSCEVRTPTRSNGKSCRNGDSCIDGNTACADGSKCKVRDGSGNDDGITEVGRKLPEMTSKGFLGAKPAPSECENGDRYCTCRDGSQCNNTEDCKDLGVGGSCEVRTPTRSNGKSCRNGNSCIDGNTACADGSKCKVRDGSGNDDAITFLL